MNNNNSRVLYLEVPEDGDDDDDDAGGGAGTGGHTAGGHSCAVVVSTENNTADKCLSLALCTWSDRFTTNASGSSCGWMAQFDYLARLNQSATEVVGVRAAVSEATYTEHSIWRKQF